MPNPEPGLSIRAAVPTNGVTVPLAFSEMRVHMYILTLDKGLNILNITEANKTCRAPTPYPVNIRK